MIKLDPRSIKVGEILLVVSTPQGKDGDFARLMSMFTFDA